MAQQGPLYWQFGAVVPGHVRSKQFKLQLKQSCCTPPLLSQLLGGGGGPRTGGDGGGGGGGLATVGRGGGSKARQNCDAAKLNPLAPMGNRR